MARTTARRGSSSNRFSMIPSVNIKRSVFDRSHAYKTTLNSGYLVPFYLDEVLPGDSFKLNVTFLCRMNTPIVPIMDNIYLEAFFFFVPARLVWDNWQKFNGEQKNPGDSTDFLIPILQGNPTFQNGSIYDYFGIPTGVQLQSANTPINSLPFRAYNLIWNEWFRDENLQNSLEVPTGDGPDSPNLFTLQKRGKRHDYFTSALPWPQKGPAVDVGLSGNAPVVGFGEGQSWTLTGVGVNNPSWYLEGNPAIRYSPKQSSEHGVPLLTHPSADSTYGDTLAFQDSSFDDTYNPLLTLSGTSSEFTGMEFSNPSVSPYADLSQVNAITINDLRQAFQIQKLLERDARGGTRYTEILRSHFGVISPDARLQRPEYLGGARSRINIVPVSQQSSTDSTSPQGNLAAFGLGVHGSRGFTKSFVEHGYIIGLVNIRTDLTYQQGLNRLFSRRSRFDFYWPSLAHLGEQAILNKEIYAQGTAVDNQVFGYQERYAEYRYFPSMITGKLRSTDAQSLDVWHLAQKFDSLPTLSSQFITENPPIDRVIAVPSEPQFFLDTWFDCKCARPMPVYGVPGLVDHF